MKANKLEKLLARNDALRKTLNYINDVMAGLERKVRELEAQPIIVPSSYRVVEKGQDDPLAQGGAPVAKLNGHTVDMDALARDVRKLSANAKN